MNGPDLRLGVMGGTFDPPHLGHLIVAEQAREQLDLDRVLFVPTGQPWRKAGRYVTPAEHRVEMVRRAIDGHPQFAPSDIEVTRRGPTYSVDTFSELARQYPYGELFFLMGEDAVMDVPGWHAPERLLELCALAVYARPGAAAFDASALEEQVPGARERVTIIHGPQLDISGTALRQRAAQGRSLRYLVPEGVERYIAEHRLYRVPSEDNGTV